MGTRATLNIQDNVREEFLEAQKGGVRWLKILIEDEDIVFKEKGRKKGSDTEDFDQLRNEVTDTSACFFLFCGDTQEETLKWTLVAFVPDASKVRDKMLYSSSRDDLKRFLGPNYFTPDFHASELDDLSSARWKESVAKGSGVGGPLTEREQILHETKLLEISEKSEAKTRTMESVPFCLSDELIERLKTFGKTQNENWMEMILDTTTEQIGLGSVKHVGAGQSLAKEIDESVARFIAIEYAHEVDGAAPRKYHCPVKEKMMYSTAKQTLLAELKKMGISFDEMMEIRSGEDLDHEMEHDFSSLSISSEGSTGVGGTGTVGQSSASSEAFSRPKRPGRGGPRRVGKFNA